MQALTRLGTAYTYWTMTSSAGLNDIRELAERFRQLASTTEMPDYAERLSATAGNLEQRAAQLESQHVIESGRSVSSAASTHTSVAACENRAA